MEIFTIGFTRSTAEHFFDRLKSHRVERLLDVRLNKRSQLAGFAKRDDLAYFLRELLDAGYEHEPLLAPTQGILDDFKKKKEMPWERPARFSSPSASVRRTTAGTTSWPPRCSSCLRTSSSGPGRC